MVTAEPCARRRAVVGPEHLHRRRGYPHGPADPGLAPGGQHDGRADAVRLGPLVDGQQAPRPSSRAHGPSPAAPSDTRSSGRPAGRPGGPPRRRPRPGRRSRSASAGVRTCPGPRSPSRVASADAERPDRGCAGGSRRWAPPPSAGAEVGGQDPHVGPRRAVDLDRRTPRGSGRRAATSKRSTVTGRGARSTSTPAGQLVEPRPADLDGRDHGRHLLDVAGQPGGRRRARRARVDRRPCPTPRPPRPRRRGCRWPCPSTTSPA